jgi:ABC-type phosphate/phosphonate transport system substrate-binding protein
MKTLRLASSTLLILTLVTGCLNQGAKIEQGPMVRVGSTRPDLFGMPAEYRALHPRLEDCFGVQVRFAAQPNGRAIGKQLELGNLQYALITAAEYADMQDTSKLTILATATNATGKTSRKALIVARATDDRLKQVSDCAGKRFAFGKYGDLLTDFAVRKALETGGTPVNKLLPEVLPPQLLTSGRLYADNDAPLKIALDLTVNVGAVDETIFARLPEKKDSAIIGPSRDQFRVIGETSAIPELTVVAGPTADPAATEKLTAYLLNSVKEDSKVCEQLGITGFAAPEPAAYEQLRSLSTKP